MKLSVSTLACPNWSLPEIIGAAAAHGIHGIDLRGIGHEIDVTRIPSFEAELGATLELLRRHELALPCLNTSIALVTPAADRWQAMLDECLRHAALAQRCGSQFVRVFGGVVPKGMSRAEAIILARRHLRQLGKICASHACKALLETHDEWSTSREVLQVVGEFLPEEIAVLWDVEQTSRHGESPDETVRALRPFIQHVHIKDSVHLDGKNVPRLLGDGDLPLNDIVRAMRRMEYAGWICLETEKRWHPQDAPEPEESLPQFVRFMNEAWHSK
jgi:sugar phosphate isomerase/epimerase